MCVCACTEGGGGGQAEADTVAPTGHHSCTAMAVPVSDLSGSLPMNLCYHLYEYIS